MKLTNKITLLVSMIAAGASFGFAQQISAPTTSDNSLLGNLGKRYAQVDLGLQDVHNTSRNFYTGSVSANVPVTSNIDVGAGAGYGWFNGNNGFADSKVEQIGTNATYYTKYNDMKPFVSVGLGYEWTKVEAGSYVNHSEAALWSGTVGIEIPLTVITLTPTVTFNDDFRTSSKSVQGVTYGLEASYWATHKLGFFVGTGYTDVLKTNSSDSWSFDLGARFRF